MTPTPHARIPAGVAVYTPITDAELAAFLRGYDLGRPRAFKGIAEGVENSNFLLETERGRFILTVYERRVRAGDLPFFLDLMAHLGGRGFPCPLPQLRRDGGALGEVRGKPAAIVSFLSGLSVSTPTAGHCREAGAAAAALHRAAAGFAGQRGNALGLAAWRPLWEGSRATAERLRPGLAAQIDADLAAIERQWPQGLPQGVVHADLFPDNVFFDGERFAGAIDFYFSCIDATAYELAVMLNAWAHRPDGALDPERAQAMVQGYDAARPLSPAERAALPVLMRGAAMRFFLTRLADWDATPEGALVVKKDPLEYAGKLAFHRAAAADPALLNSLWNEA